MKRRVLKNFDLYSVRDAAAYLDLSTGAIHDYVKAGLIETLRASNCSLLFTRDALERFKKSNAERKAAIARLSISNLKAKRTA